MLAALYPCEKPNRHCVLCALCKEQCVGSSYASVPIVRLTDLQPYQALDVMWKNETKASVGSLTQRNGKHMRYCIISIAQVKAKNFLFPLKKQSATILDTLFSLL